MTGSLEHVLVVGGGIGGAIAHDLSLRGFQVTLVEKGEILSGSTGRHHGLLHSGARYAMHDTVAARECIEENRILRRIAPEGIEPNGGLFVALNEQDLAHLDPFLESCARADIPARQISPDEARAREPNLAPGILAALRFPTPRWMLDGCRYTFLPPLNTMAPISVPFAKWSISLCAVKP